MQSSKKRLEKSSLFFDGLRKFGVDSKLGAGKTRSQSVLVFAQGKMLDAKRAAESLRSVLPRRLRAIILYERTSPCLAKSRKKGAVFSKMRIFYGFQGT